eukprot:c20205_g1_i2 orf=140-2077(+)
MAFDCVVRQRKNPTQHKRVVRIGCGAGFAGDRPAAALNLLLSVPDMHYLILECLAERTLALRYEAMMAGGKGYDPRISEWMSFLLPEAMKRHVCIITNMGAVDALGAQEEVLRVAKNLGISAVVSVAWELIHEKFDEGVDALGTSSSKLWQGSSTYLGAAPVVHILETSEPNVIITSRLADASLFLAPMVFELGWNWNDYEKLAQGTLAAHLLECGCQVTGGYYMHPVDENRNFSFEQLLQISLPYADVSWDGDVTIAKSEQSGGELSIATCAQQLLYEIGNPAAYITPDVVVDFRNVTFHELTINKVFAKGAIPSSQLCPEKLLCIVAKECGWKGWGEISYGGPACIKRAAAAEYLVRSWMEVAYPTVNKQILSYVIGIDSLRIHPCDEESGHRTDVVDVRLRMDGLFSSSDQALRFIHEFESLYTNGPAGGSGISTGHKKEVLLEKMQVSREEIFWQSGTRAVNVYSSKELMDQCKYTVFSKNNSFSKEFSQLESTKPDFNHEQYHHAKDIFPAPSGVKIPLYNAAHSRTGDKGNDLNFSIIPHYPPDLPRLQQVITSEWVKKIMSSFLAYDNVLWGMGNGHYDSVRGIDDRMDVEIYEVHGIKALNVVVKNVLDGGVNCSRRIDRHGKSLSDLVLCQMITLS